MSDDIVKEWSDIPGTGGWVLQERADGFRQWVYRCSGLYLTRGWVDPAAAAPHDPLVLVPENNAPTMVAAARVADPLELDGACRYRRPKALMRAPRKIAHEKLYDTALAEIKSWVAANYREWPYCVWGGTVTLRCIEKTVDPAEGSVWLGVLECSKCGHG